MLKMGLTGGIASGKSTVASILAKHDAWLIDADVISRASTQSGGAAMTAIRSCFGDQVVMLDGSLNREAMRQIILSDKGAKDRLESIVHPLIGERIDEQLLSAEKAEALVAVLDIPLLVESGTRWRSRLDAIWVVDCLPQTQITRVHQRSGWPITQIEAVMGAQASRSKRLEAADAMIFNDDLSLMDLEVQVLGLLNFTKQSLLA
jgi:dephospho-CoA kinase